MDVLRLSPQSQNMAQAIRLFDGARNGDMTGTQAQDSLRALLPARTATATGTAAPAWSRCGGRA